MKIKSDLYQILLTFPKAYISNEGDYAAPGSQSRISLHFWFPSTLHCNYLWLLERDPKVGSTLVWPTAGSLIFIPGHCEEEEHRGKVIALTFLFLLYGPFLRTAGISFKLVFCILSIELDLVCVPFILSDTWVQ